MEVAQEKKLRDEEEKKESMARVSAILVEFCRQKDFFGAEGQVSSKVDTMREFT